MDTPKNIKHYRRLLFMAILSFVSMYVLMYAMVNTFTNVHNNLNQFYMAGLMAAPMVVIELFFDGCHVPQQEIECSIGISVILLAAFFLFIRQQAAISDKQFLKSMIPHHAGAILMCEEASIQDPGIKDLCRRIISSQQSEIDEMNAKLSELEK